MAKNCMDYNKIHRCHNTTDNDPNSDDHDNKMDYGDDVNKVSVYIFYSGDVGDSC